MLWSILTLPLYIEGTRFLVRSDHKPLRWLIDIDDSTERLIRWRLRLSPFDLDIAQRPCRKHRTPDAGLRLTSPTEHEYPVVDDEISAFENALLAVTTRSAVPPSSPEKLQNMMAATGDDHGSDRNHPDNV